MDRNDQQAIEGLFSKLANVERQSGNRDAESERFIQNRISQQPGAPYFMAQTIVVQEQALEAAQRRIDELEARGAPQQQQARSGGLFSGMFGSSTPPQQQAAPGAVSPAGGRPSPWGGAARNAAPVAPQGAGGGGFLAGAAQTAMGVAGGMLLGNAIMGMFGGNEAQAAETPAQEPAEEAPEEEMDFGGDDMEF